MGEDFQFSISYAWRGMTKPSIFSVCARWIVKQLLYFSPFSPAKFFFASQKNNFSNETICSSIQCWQSFTCRKFQFRLLIHSIWMKRVGKESFELFTNSSSCLRDCRSRWLGSTILTLPPKHADSRRQHHELSPSVKWIIQGRTASHVQQ